jgi:hypothetical protein
MDLGAMLRTRLFHRIDEVDPVRWGITGSDPFSSTAVLRALEKAKLPGVRMRYVVLEDPVGRWVAATSLASLEIDGARLTHGLFRGIIETVRRLNPGFLRTRLMVCGTPLSVGNPPVRLVRGTDAVVALRTLGGVLDEVAEEERSSWRAFKEFPATQLDAARMALCSGTSRWSLVPSEPNCGMSVPWRSFEAYLADLRSHYRYKIRKAARRLATDGVETDVAPLDGAYDARAHALYEQVFQRADVQLERLTEGFFRALGSAFGDRALLIRFRRHGELVGWVAMLLDGSVAYDLFHGIDYSGAGDSDLYFNQLASAVRLAIRRRVAYLSLGQSTLTAKARFGAEAVPLWLALRHRSAVLNRTIAAGRRKLFPGTEFPRRQVFREPA